LALKNANTFARCAYIHAKLTGSAFMSYGESGETSPVRVARYTVSAAAAVTPDRLCDRDEFDDIDAPLASLTLATND
jgi:hypothetical protein